MNSRSAHHMAHQMAGSDCKAFGLDWATYRKLIWIVLFAFAVRVAVRWSLGSEDFWVNGYGFFFELAQNIAA